MSAAGTPRCAIVGVRRVRQGLGEHYARHLAKHGAAVVAFVDVSPEAVEEGRRLLAGSGIDARGYTDVDAMLAAVPVDALVVASPAATHLAYLCAAAARRISVLCDKPFVWGCAAPERAAAEVVADLRAAGAVVMESCQWPETLSAFDALHPGARAGGLRSFEMWLSPSRPGVEMVVEAVSHPVSLLQALTGADGGAVEDVRFSTRDPAAGSLDASFLFLGGGARVPATVRLRIVPDQPRPAGYAINGLRAERRIRMEDYAMTLEDAGRSVPMPDPLESLVGRFVAACRAPRAARDAEHESSRIAARVAILDHVVAQFRRP